MIREFEDRLRLMTVSQLQILLVLCGGIASSQDLEKLLGRNAYQTGSIIGAIRKARINGEQLILPCGKGRRSCSYFGFVQRWQLNKRVVLPSPLKKFLEEMEISIDV